MKDVTAEIEVVGLRSGEIYLGQVDEFDDGIRINNPIMAVVGQGPTGNWIVQMGVTPPILTQLVDRDKLQEHAIFIPNDDVRFKIAASAKTVNDYNQAAFKSGYTSIQPASNVIDITKN